ncbi:MAG TPA: 8-amino-7-oxononanoate synthase [Nitrospiria bacterium]|nr:8-amino-7-oxononanoate synthase [Nitrospiria bacterium]
MFEEKLREIRLAGLYRSPLLQEGGQFPEVVVDGKKVISFSSNNYLGLSEHPEIIQSGIEALERYGGGSGASRLLGGSRPPHHELESEIARFKGYESALLFGCGYLANLAILSSIPGVNDLILADRLNHASLMDGCRLSRASFRVYRHRDMAHLKALLTKKKAGQKVFIVTEGVFSMDGDMAPLPEILSLAREYRACLILDDAHGFGVAGKSGKGTAEYFGMQNEIDIEMGTLGKAAGVYGAFVTGNKGLVEYLINVAKPFIYNTALPPHIASMARAAVRIISGSSGLRERLLDNRRYLGEKLRNAGFSIPADPTPIIPIITGAVSRTMDLSRFLFGAGLFLPAIRPPTVPDGMSRLRISLSSAHTRPHLDKAVEILTEGGKRFGLL